MLDRCESLCRQAEAEEPVARQDPEISAGIGDDPVDDLQRRRRIVIELGRIGCDRVAVVPVEAMVSAEPQRAIGGLGNGVHTFIGQAIGGGDMFEPGLNGLRECCRGNMQRDKDTGYHPPGVAVFTKACAHRRLGMRRD